MRALFLALLLINLGFFYWQYSLSGGPQPVAENTEVIQDDTVPRLLLLSEAQGAQGAQTPAATAADSDACYIVGPFSDQTEARTAVEDFKAQNIEASYDPRQQQNSRYWLHTPQMRDHKAAEAKLRALKKMGIEDVGIMESGDMQNSLSLGFYHNESSAQQRLEELKAKGVNVSLETQTQTVDTHWVKYQAPLGSEAADKVWKAISQAQPDLQREDLPCR
jgi:hypothetical protein